MENFEAGVCGGVLWLFITAICAVTAIAQWKIFEKAGQPGWACIVPIYNIVILLRITNKPEWWILLMFVPIANFVIAIMISIELAKAFGQSDGFAAGLILLPIVFYPILGFGDARYSRPSAVSVPNYDDSRNQDRTEQDSRFHR